jgi:hypothetical protein
MAVTQDPDAMRVLQAAALMNMEGEGLADIRDHFRRQLVQMGVIKPTDEEAQQMQAAGQQQDPNAVFLQAAAEEAMAKAAKANADVVKTIAESELTQAKTAETLMKIDGGDAPSMSQGGQMQAAPMMSERERLELDSMRIENALKQRQLDNSEAQLAQVYSELDAKNAETQSSQGIQQVVEGLGESAAAIGDAVAQMRDAVSTLAESNKANVDRALQSINRPKRLVRERGRIARIEVE